MKETIEAVVAMTDSGVIGKDGDLPWKRQSGDLKHFREITMGHSVIMGRKTAESIIQRNDGPLDGRTNFVLTHDRKWKYPGFYTCIDIHEVFHCFDGKLFVIGGASLYEQMLSNCVRLHITRIQANVSGDAIFPKVDFTDWILAKQTEIFLPDEKNEFPYSFLTWERNPPPPPLPIIQTA